MELNQISFYNVQNIIGFVGPDHPIGQIMSIGYETHLGMVSHPFNS